MKKILIVYDIPGWAYWRRAMALQKFKPEDFEVDIVQATLINHKNAAKNYDLVFVIEYTHGELAVRKIREAGSDIPVVVSHNSDGHRRRDLLNLLCHKASFVIVNNQHAYIANGCHPKSCCISNGIDFDLFYPEIPIEEREHRVIWCGSSGLKKKKGYQDILLPMEKKLKRSGITCDLRPIDGNGWKDHEPNREIVYDTERQRDWYNSASYVVCSSATEGTPNFVLEAAACGCVPVSTKVGNILEFGRDGVNCVLAKRDSHALAKAVEQAKENRERMSIAVRESLASWSYEFRAKYFFNLFRKLINKERVESFSYIDKDADRI